MTPMPVSRFDQACEAASDTRSVVQKRVSWLLGERRRRITSLVDQLLDAIDTSPDLPWEVQRCIEALAHEVGIVTPDCRRHR